MAVRDRGLFYYRLLSSGVIEVMKVLSGPKSDPSLGVLVDRTEQPINSWVTDFNTLTPLYDKKPYESLSASLTKCELPSVAKQLEDLQSPENPEVCKVPIDLFSLINDIAITPELFEKKWTSIATELCLNIEWKQDAEPDLLLTSLHVLNIYTIAKSKAGTQPWKSYLYAQDSNGNMFLVELILGTNPPFLKAIIKQDTENKDTLTNFVSLLKSAVSTVLKLIR